MEYLLRTPEEVQSGLAERFVAARLALGLKQATLAERAGVSLGSLRRFERTGEVSLKHLVRLSHAVGRLEELEGLFVAAEARSISELEARAAGTTRKRGAI